MIIDYIAIVVIAICTGVVIYIISKKFPIISSINTESLDKHKQDKIKKGLIEGRLIRKFKAFKFKRVVSNNQEEQKSSILNKFSSYLKKIEKQYHDKIKESEPEQKGESEKKKQILNIEAKEHFEAERFKEAEDKYIEAISLDSKYTEAYEGLAETYFKLKDYNHAEEVYKFLLKINSQDDTEVDQNNLNNKDDASEAGNGNTSSISLNNRLASYHIDLGDVYMATEEYEKALVCFKEAISLEPGNPRNLDAIIEVAIKLKDVELAKEHLEKLKEVNPENNRLDEFKKEIDKIKKKVD